MTHSEKYIIIGGIHSITESCARKYSWVFCTKQQRMNRQESAEGDVVKWEDGVAGAFGVQLMPARAGYLGTFAHLGFNLANYKYKSVELGDQLGSIYAS